MNVVITFDGLCEPKNPGGEGAWGCTIHMGGKKCVKDFGHLGHPKWMSNNYAEYCALGFALAKLIEIDLPKIESLTIIGDSQLVVNQVTGKWSVKNDRLKKLHGKCMEYLGEIVSRHEVEYTMVWVPRELNTLADELSNQGYSSSIHNPGAMS